MTPNNYASLRGTIARAKRHDSQKVVMRVTLAEELLEQLSKAEAHYCHVSDNADSRYSPHSESEAKNNGESN